MQYKKLTTGPVKHGSHFSIACISTGQLVEIEGKYTNGKYTVALLHQPAYKQTYTEYGTEATADEWNAAVCMLNQQVHDIINQSVIDASASITIHDNETPVVVHDKIGNTPLS